MKKKYKFIDSFYGELFTYLNFGTDIEDDEHTNYCMKSLIEKLSYCASYYNDVYWLTKELDSDGWLANDELYHLCEKALKTWNNIK